MYDDSGVQKMFWLLDVRVVGFMGRTLVYCTEGFKLDSTVFPILWYRQIVRQQARNYGKVLGIQIAAPFLKRAETPFF